MHLKTSKIYQGVQFFYLPCVFALRFLSYRLSCSLSAPYTVVNPICVLCILLASPISARYLVVFVSFRYYRKHHKAPTPVLSPAVAMDEESEVIRIEALCKSLYESQNAGERQEAEKALVTFQNSSGHFTLYFKPIFIKFRHERILRIAEF